jgi:hypothetical protein
MFVFHFRENPGSPNPPVSRPSAPVSRITAYSDELKAGLLFFTYTI